MTRSEPEYSRMASSTRLEACEPNNKFSCPVDMTTRSVGKLFSHLRNHRPMRWQFMKSGSTSTPCVSICATNSANTQQLESRRRLLDGSPSNRTSLRSMWSAKHLLMGKLRASSMADCRLLRDRGEKSIGTSSRRSTGTDPGGTNQTEPGASITSRTRCRGGEDVFPTSSKRCRNPRRTPATARHPIW